MENMIDPGEIYPFSTISNTTNRIIKDYIYVSIDKVIYQVTFSFALGLIFAPWSPGLFLVILFILIFEMAYGLIVQKFTVEQLFIRLAIVSAYFIGWLLGRIIIGDEKPIRMFFDDEHNDMGRVGHRHPALKKIKSNMSATMNNDLIEEAGFRYVATPNCIDEVDRSNQNEKWSFFADQYELQPEPDRPILSKERADSLFNNIVTSI